MQYDECPWNTAPVTLEDLVQAIKAQDEWELENMRSAPYEWNIIVTRTMFSNLAERVIILEKKEESK